MSQNSSDLWLPDFPHPAREGHKYNRGHAVIYGGPEKTGAARLAAQACARMGAGLTTICAPKGKGDLYRMEIQPHLMVSEEPFASLLDNPKVTAFCIGPGAGAGIADTVLAALKTGKPCVLDADALMTFEDIGIFHNPNILHPHVVLTPHQGEYKKMMRMAEISPAEMADIFGCTVVLKGASTHVAAPDSYAVNDVDAPYLATAGTGDVLAGMIAGLLAQGMVPFKAACAAVWIHAEAGRALGAGLVASDLPDHIPLILKDLGL